jgi:hypothetical protein
MAMQRVIDAYVRGELDRRGFITRLTALGVSASAAAAYALTLGGQSAAAAPGSSTGVMREHLAQDEDYDTDVDLDSDELGVQLTASALSLTAGILGGLGNFAPGDFVEPNAFDILSTIADQLQEQADALAALPGAEEATTPETVTSPTSEAFLDDLAGSFDDLANLHAAVVPAIENGGIRQTLMNIASINSRHAALVNHLADNEPLPGSFAEPSL